MNNQYMLRFMVSELHLSTYYLGFKYILRGLEILDATPDTHKVSLMKDICEVVAREFNTTSSAVERNIRHAISKWVESDSSYTREIRERIFPRETNITCKRFLFTIHEYRKVFYQEKGE